VRLAKLGTLPQFVLEQYGAEAQRAVDEPAQFLPTVQKIMRAQLREWERLHEAERHAAALDAPDDQLPLSVVADPAFPLSLTKAGAAGAAGKLGAASAGKAGKKRKPELSLSGTAGLFVDDNVNRVFELPLAQLQAIVPEGVSKELAQVWKDATGDARLLVRQSTVSLISELAAMAKANFQPSGGAPVPALSAEGRVDAHSTPGVPPVPRRDALGNRLRDEPADVRADRLVLELGAHTPTIFIDGVAGSGKSVTLLQTVLWARTNGWIVLFVNDADSLLNGGFQSTPSPVWRGMFDQNAHAQSFVLQPFLTAHSADLAARHCQTSMADAVLAALKSKAATFAADDDSATAEAAASAPAAAEAPAKGKKGAKGGKDAAGAAAAAAKPKTSALADVLASVDGGKVTLLQLAQVGLEQKAFAASIVAALVAELACIVDTPVMIALDNVNALSKPSHVFYDPALLKVPGLKATRSRKDVDYNSLESVRNAPSPSDVLQPSQPGAPAANLRKNQLTLARALGGLEAQGLANGVVIGATSSQHSRYFIEEDDRAERAVHIDAYTSEEMLAVMQDYVETGFVLQELTAVESEYVAAITARRPREVLQYAGLL
jgi:hypothetical protein